MRRLAVSSIPPEQPFVDTLARGILARAATAGERGDPLALARTLILLPTRRACRSLREAFLRAGDGEAMILPRMRPLGDVDEDELALSDGLGGLGGDGLSAAGSAQLALPPAIPELRRRLLLAERLMAGRADLSAEHAAWLAVELAGFLDRAQTERLGLDRLDQLVPDAYAEHWQRVVAFLSVLATDWPTILDREGALDPADRRNRLLETLASAWRDRPPDHPVIAAGSTGSIPATADLLAVVAGLPRGEVVLPGLDRHLDNAAWSHVADEPAHPQHGLALLLGRFELTRDDVLDFDAAAESDPTRSARARIVSAALAPANADNPWRRQDRALLDPALRGVARIDAATPREEAGAIAMVLREALERPGRTAALITPDRALARRVAAELGRWGLEIDDSAGMPLGASAPGTFLRLVATVAAEGLVPVPLLAALKHPLAAGGRAPADFRDAVRRLEIAVLRGARPGAGIDGLRSALAQEQNPDKRARRRPVDTRGLDAWLDDLGSKLAPLLDAMAADDASLATLVRAHVRAAEALAASDGEYGDARLWSGEPGEDMAAFVADLVASSDGLPTIRPREYPALFDACLSGRVVRPRYGRHPRLSIWGLLEARLQRADVVVLGGLNEGTWPPETLADPWMSRPMRAEFGLPLPERRIGLAAHDFAQAMGAEEVYLTRAVRVEGTPTVPSRWLLRLEAALHGLAGTDPASEADDPWPRLPTAAWHRALDAPEAMPRSVAPAPRPPVEARPRTLSVTQIERLMRDPYALYASKVLDLEALDPIDADPGAADKGIVVHDALERFVRAHPDVLPADPLPALTKFGAEAFEPVMAHPGVWAFWWPRFLRVAAWFADRERERRPAIAKALAERRGEITLAAPLGAFTLKAFADRIDRAADGTLSIIDYKTGAPPSKKQVEAGFAPQLPLEAVIARAGGFEGVPAGEVGMLAFWQLSGGTPPGKITELKEPGRLADEALDGLSRLIAAFDKPETPYRATPRLSMALRYNDYAHLERIGEWAAAEDGE